jgi:hypothetical protein
MRDYSGRTSLRLVSVYADPQALPGSRIRLVRYPVVLIIRVVGGGVV